MLFQAVFQFVFTKTADYLLFLVAVVAPLISGNQNVVHREKPMLESNFLDACQERRCVGLD